MIAHRIPITAIVLTYNEAIIVERCLGAMASVDEIIVVDSLSTDGTIDLVRQVRQDARIFSNPFQDFGQQRNWALDNAMPKHDWVLFVDADEYCTPELLTEIAAFVQKPGDAVGGFIAGKNYFLGRWLKYSTLYPSYQLRLLKRGSVRFRKEGHGQREVTGERLAYLSSGWTHDAFSKGLHQWISRHNQYSTEEIELLIRLRVEAIAWRDLLGAEPIRRRRSLKRLGARMPFRPLARFLYVYLWRRGFLDGHPGLIFCMIRFAHDIHIMAKLAEKRHLENGPPIVTEGVAVSTINILRRRWHHDRALTRTLRSCEATCILGASRTRHDPDSSRSTVRQDPD